MRLTLYIVTVSIVLCVFQQPSAPREHTNNKPSKAAQPNPITKQNTAEPITANDSSERDRDGHQNIQIATSTPEKSVDPIERAISIVNVVCTIALAIVGVCGIRVAVNTLREMRRQREETARQVEASILQVRAMQEQITEMSNQTEVSRLNVDAFIKSQRAWVVTRIVLAEDNLKEASTYDGQGRFIKTTLNIVLRCRNDGDTPAGILSQTIWCRTYSEAPPHFPDTSDVSFTDHGFQPISIRRTVKTKASLDSFEERRAFSGKVTILYAVVKYKDTFGEHETWCGYIVRGDLGHAWLERLAGYDEYNKYS